MVRAGSICIDEHRRSPGQSRLARIDSIPDVRRYLDEFLMDRYVLDIPAPIRALIVKGLILPTRPENSAEAYAKIWTE